MVIQICFPLHRELVKSVTLFCGRVNLLIEYIYIVCVCVCGWESGCVLSEGGGREEQALFR